MAEQDQKKQGLLGNIGGKIKEAVNTEQGQKIKEDLTQRAKGALGGLGGKLKEKVGIGGDKPAPETTPEARPSAPSHP